MFDGEAIGFKMLGLFKEEVGDHVNALQTITQFSWAEALKQMMVSAPAFAAG